MDQLTGNVVAVTQPGVVEHFVKLADGSYNPPPGSAARLTLDNGAYTYVAKDRTTLSFDTNGKSRDLAQCGRGDDHPDL